MNIAVKDLIDAYDDYIRLLERAESSLLTLAVVHGFRTPEALIEQGNVARAKIADLKSKLSQ